MSQHAQNDIAIVGAGPAGATAAFLLAKHGYHVLLVDRSHFPRPKLCAGLLTWKTVQLLADVFQTSTGASQSHGLIHTVCREYQIVHKNKMIAARRLEDPFHFIDRANYDHHWLLKAEAAGARVETGIGVVRVDPDEPAIVLADGRRIQARLIIGADGVWSKVRRAMPKRRFARQRKYRGLAATIEALQTHHEADTADATAALHFGYVPWGYAWSFPGRHGRTVGMAALPTRGAPSIRRAFDAFLAALGENPTRISPFKSYPLPFGNYMGRPAHGKLLLTGDACGLADPLLGEGIYYAHRSGQLAAESIIGLHHQWSNVAARYCTLLNRHVIHELRWIHLFRNLLFTGGMRRRYRGLNLFFRLFPKRLEAAVHGRRSFSRLLLP